MQNSASYFLGDQQNDSLQRLYGISFPDSKQMTEYKQFLLEAAKRDHRKIGKVSSSFAPTFAACAVLHSSLAACSFKFH